MLDSIADATEEGGGPPEVLYHWSSAVNRGSISVQGLVTGFESHEIQGLRSEYVCASSTAEEAWAYSGRRFASPGDEWDLWRVAVSDRSMWWTPRESPEWRCLRVQPSELTLLKSVFVGEVD